MKYTDEDIQFLGGKTSPQPSPSGRANHASSLKWIIGAAIAVVVVIAGCILGWNYYQEHKWKVSFDYPLSRSSSEIINDLNKPNSSTFNVQRSTFIVDSIDGVSFKMYDLSGLKATISRTMPSDTDSTVMLVTQAWDYYYNDKKEYKFLGDFVMNGNVIANASRKAGFVVTLPDGRWQMGISCEDSVKDYIVSHRGSMFRQFALVSSGQICLTQFALKGKVHRRALARRPGSTSAVYIETLNKESLYDLAEALSDYGFIDAIYLTGGDGDECYYRDAAGIVHGDYAKWRKKSNLLVFRK